MARNWYIQSISPQLPMCAWNLTFSYSTLNEALNSTLNEALNSTLNEALNSTLNEALNLTLNEACLNPTLNH